MKILYITGQLIIHGGIERVTTAKMNYLASEKEHEVFLLTYEQTNHPFVFDLDKRIHTHDIGINYNVDYSCESLYSFKFLKKVPKHIRETKKYLKQINPDVIIVPNFGYEFYFLPFITTIPLVREYHDSQYKRNMIQSMKQKCLYAVEKFTLRHYESIVLLNESETKFFDSGLPIKIIPNPVYLCKQSNKCRENIIVTAGRLTPVKGYDMLIEIWSKIPAVKRNGWILEIYGDGTAEYKVYLENLVSEYKLTDSVRFCGKTDNVYSNFLNSKIFVCTSLTESFGLVLVEAASCGLPIVSFDCPTGPRHIVNHQKDGFLVSDYSKDAFAKYLEELIEDESMRLKFSEHAIINSKRFDIGQVMNKWLELFNHLKKS